MTVRAHPQRVHDAPDRDSRLALATHSRVEARNTLHQGHSARSTREANLPPMCRRTVTGDRSSHAYASTASGPVGCFRLLSVVGGLGERAASAASPHAPAWRAAASSSEPFVMRGRSAGGRGAYLFINQCRRRRSSRYSAMVVRKIGILKLGYGWAHAVKGREGRLR